MVKQYDSIPCLCHICNKILIEERERECHFYCDSFHLVKCYIKCVKTVHLIIDVFQMNFDTIAKMHHLASGIHLTLSPSLTVYL